MTHFIDRTLGFVAVFIAVVLLVELVIRARYKRLARQRRGEDLTAFKRCFEAREIPIDVVESGYRNVQEWAGEPGIPVRPSDILATYGLGFEHFDEFLAHVVASAGRRASERIIAEAMPPLKTVEDIVLFVASCRAAA